MDILYPKIQQGKKYDNCLLFIPCNIEYQWKVVDIIQSKDFWVSQYL
jgi:hypothetical protein